MKSAKSNNLGKSVIQTNYDIVTKGHGGKIEVVSAPDKGTMFNVFLNLAE